MKKIIKLTESDLTKLVKRVVKEYHYEDDDDKHEDYVNDRDQLTNEIMMLLKPYYEKHGKEITLDFLDDVEHMIKEKDPFYYY